MAEPQAAKRRSMRPPLWVMSVLVAAAVLFYLVENRPVAKHVVSAKPAATKESPARPAAHRSTAKATKQAKPSKPASAPVTFGPGPTTAQTQNTAAPALPSSTPQTTAPSTPATVPAVALMGVLPRTD